MRTTLFGSCSLSIGAVAVASALAQAPAAPRPAGPGETTLTLTGCVKSWDGAGGRPSTSGPAARYMLSNVQARSQAGGITPASYVLVGDSAVNLAGHLNHKVELSGVIAADSNGNPTDRPIAGRTRPATSTPSASKATERGNMGMPTLRVTSVRMLEPQCP